MVKNLNKQQKLNLLGWILLTIFLIVYWYFIYKYTFLLTDSDLASGFVYAKLLINEKTILSKNWYFATFVDIFNIDKFYLIGMLISDNYQIAQFIGTILANLFLLGSFVFACKSLNIKYIPWLSFLVMGAMSYDYSRFVNYYPVYGIYIIFTFIIIGLINNYVNSESEKQKNVYLILSFISALFICTNGIRNIATIIAPAFGASALLYFSYLVLKKQLDEKIYNLLKINVALIIGSLIGFIINKLLSQYVGYNNNEFALTSEPLRDVIGVFKKVFTAWFNMFGITEFNFSHLLEFIFLLIIVVYSIYYLFSKDIDLSRKYIVLLFVLAACATSLSFFISDLNIRHNYRYFLQAYSILYLVVGFIITDLNWSFKFPVFLCLIIMIVFNTNKNFVTQINSYSINNSELMDICEILENNDVLQGYASYWNSNIIYELSNGTIETITFQYDNEIEIENKEIVRYNWLHEKDEHIDKNKSCFLILNTSNEELYEDLENYQIYRGDQKMLYIFENSYELINEINKK